MARPNAVAIAALEACKGASIPLHVSSFLQKWAAKYTLQGAAPAWHEMLNALSLPGLPRVVEHAEGRVSFHLKADEESQDPLRQMTYNANGFASRWRSSQVASELEIRSFRSKKARYHKRRVAKGDFKTLVSEAGSPDLLSLTETKISLAKLMALPGFLSWCHFQGYHHGYLAWSGDDTKGGAGYAGVMVLSRYKALAVSFDGGQHKNKEARIISLQFPSFTHIAVYAPCTGYVPERMVARVEFDSGLLQHTLQVKRSTSKPVVCAGDFNVTPRRQDFHEKAFEHLRDVKAKYGAEHHPGSSPQELQNYHAFLKATDTCNSWEVLYPHDEHGMTWHPPTDPDGLRGWGQRLDHFLCSKEFHSGTWKYKISSMVNYKGKGSSDHNPLCIHLEKVGPPSARAERVPIPDGGHVYAMDIMDCGTGRAHTFKSVECPRVQIAVEGALTEVFCDTGAPFSVYNPPAGSTIQAEYPTAVPTGSSTNCSFTGAAGGRIQARQNYIFKVRPGSSDIPCRVVVLDKHEPNMPTFLLGMDVLVGLFQGFSVTPEVPGQANKMYVTFGVEPSKKFPCANFERRKPPSASRAPASLLQGLDEQQVEEKLPMVAKLFASARSRQLPELDDDAFIYGGDRQQQEQDFPNLSSDPECCWSAEMPAYTQASPLPVVEVCLQAPGSASDHIVPMLVDSGASLNLVSSDLVRRLLHDPQGRVATAFKNVPFEELPCVQTAAGTVIKALGCVELQLKLQGAVKSEPVEFYVFQDLPVQGILGHDTNTKWEAQLSWKDRTWTITPDRGKGPVVVPWRSTSPRWRAPFKLRAAQDFVVPPKSHAKVPVTSPTTRILRKHAVHGSFGFVEPSPFAGHMVAHGVADAPSWVQVANPSEEPLLLVKGEYVGDFVTDEQCSTRPVSLDPTMEELWHEREAKRAKIQAALDARKNAHVGSVKQESAPYSAELSCPPPLGQDGVPSWAPRARTLDQNGPDHPADGLMCIGPGGTSFTQVGALSATPWTVVQAPVASVASAQASALVSTRGECILTGERSFGSSFGRPRSTSRRRGRGQAMIGALQTEAAPHPQARTPAAPGLPDAGCGGAPPIPTSMAGGRTGAGVSLRCNSAQTPFATPKTPAPTMMPVVSSPKMDACSVCEQAACAKRTEAQETAFLSLLAKLKADLGVSMEQAMQDRHRCEVEKLATWCLSQGDVITASGEFQPGRVVPHNTTCSINLTVESPFLQARPSKTSPQHKQDIAEMVQAKLRQGIIEN